MFYEQKEKFRSIFNQHLTKEAGEIALNQWIEEARAMHNQHLNKFLYTLNHWKCIKNFFPPLPGGKKIKKKKRA
ncbi:MAG: transposase [Candidatus Competibacteraceae bacterium]|nr:transposase [Candidatus Competibacteraceae bacterium]